MLLGEGHGPARIRIGVAGAADHKHRLHIGKAVLNQSLGEARVVAAQLIVVRTERAESRDGGAKEDGP